MTSLAIDVKDISRAAERLAGTAVRTPLLANTGIDDLAGRPVLVKCENLQRGGAFKFRGAYNAITEATEKAPVERVIAYSSGNHGIAVSLASKLHGAQATIVCPTDAPPEKRSQIERYGASIVDYDRQTGDRAAIAATLQGEGSLLVPPYDLAAVMAGQGTVGLEILEQVGDTPVEAVLVPVGGGGLISGISVAVKSLMPGVKVIGVEPAAARDTYDSLRAGERLEIPPPDTIADGLRSQTPGELTFPVIQELVDEIVLVSEAEIAAAMAAMFLHAHVVAEPSGAVTLAAALSGRAPLSAAGRVCIVVSGGNISPARFCAELPAEG